MSDDGDWETAEEFVIPASSCNPDPTDPTSREELSIATFCASEIPEDEWMSAVPAEITQQPEQPKQVHDDGNPPLILVDFTVLSKGAIHNRFDKNSVNDVEAKSALSKKITADYAAYADNADLIAAGTIRACADAVWREALSTLRDEVPGLFWGPIFPA